MEYNSLQIYSLMRYQLFIGRWQPFHEGHQKLIQTVIDEGKTPLVAIRDTEIDEKNPFTVEQRKEFIREVFPNIEIIVIPDIEAVCYGRDVGYEVRKIDLDKETEEISATKIRESMKHD